MELPKITILDEKDKRLHQKSEEVTFPLDKDLIKTINDSLDYLEMSQDEEIAKILGVSEYDISNALSSLKEPVSMYEPIYNDGGDTIYLCDQLSLPKEEYDKDLRLALEKAMEKLKPRELHILKDRFLIGKTQMEIASELGISQAQISRIEKSAITNILRYFIRNKNYNE